MSVNLLDLAKGYLTDAVVDKAASFLGESTQATQSGLSHALPALLSGLMGKANSQSGASDLLGMISKPELGGGLLDNIGDLFGGSNNGLMDLGGSLLSGVLGDKLGGITDLIGNTVGFKNSSSSSGILKMVAPFLLSLISKKVGNGGVSGLLNLLGGQKDYLEKDAPAGFMDKILGTLSIGSLGNLASGLTSNASNFASSTSNAVNETANDVKKGGNKMLPLLALLALLAIAFFAYKNCTGKTAIPKTNIEKGLNKAGDAIEKGANKVVDGVKNVAGAVVEDVNSLYQGGKDLIGKTVKGFENLGEFVSRKLKNGYELIIPSKGFEAQLVNFIEEDKAIDKNAWFNMRRVLFKTGSAELDERSMTQIENTANILKAYPNINIKIGGYTDNTGNPENNKVLSGKRATAVLQALVGKGIDATRLSAEGYGQEHPIASNDTEEGKQLNRRVAARVTKK